jgi:hypothetical protein
MDPFLTPLVWMLRVVTANGACVQGVKAWN